MIISLLAALIYIAILCVFAWAVVAILGSLGISIPAPIVIVFKVVVAVLCLVVLLQAITGGVGLDWPYLTRRL